MQDWLGVAGAGTLACADSRYSVSTIDWLELESEMSYGSSLLGELSHLYCVVGGIDDWLKKGDVYTMRGSEMPDRDHVLNDPKNGKNTKSNKRVTKTVLTYPIHRSLKSSKTTQ